MITRNGAQKLSCPWPVDRRCIAAIETGNLIVNQSLHVERSRRFDKTAAATLRETKRFWCRLGDLNTRPPHYERRGKNIKAF